MNKEYKRINMIAEKDGYRRYDIEHIVDKFYSFLDSELKKFEETDDEDKAQKFDEYIKRKFAKPYVNGVDDRDCLFIGAFKGDDYVVKIYIGWFLDSVSGAFVEELSNLKKHECVVFLNDIYIKNFVNNEPNLIFDTLCNEIRNAEDWIHGSMNFTYGKSNLVFDTIDKITTDTYIPIDRIPIDRFEIDFKSDYVIQEDGSVGYKKKWTNPEDGTVTDLGLALGEPLFKYDYIKIVSKGELPNQRYYFQVGTLKELHWNWYDQKGIFHHFTSDIHNEFSVESETEISYTFDYRTDKIAVTYKNKTMYLVVDNGISNTNVLPFTHTKFISDNKIEPYSDESGEYSFLPYKFLELRDTTDTGIITHYDIHPQFEFAYKKLSSAKMEKVYFDDFEDKQFLQKKSDEDGSWLYHELKISADVSKDFGDEKPFIHKDRIEYHIENEKVIKKFQIASLYKHLFVFSSYDENTNEFVYRAKYPRYDEWLNSPLKDVRVYDEYRVDATSAVRLSKELVDVSYTTTPQISREEFLALSDEDKELYTTPHFVKTEVFEECRYVTNPSDHSRIIIESTRKTVETAFGVESFDSNYTEPIVLCDDGYQNKKYDSPNKYYVNHVRGDIDGIEVDFVYYEKMTYTPKTVTRLYMDRGFTDVDDVRYREYKLVLYEASESALLRKDKKKYKDREYCEKILDDMDIYHNYPNDEYIVKEIIYPHPLDKTYWTTLRIGNDFRIYPKFNNIYGNRFTDYIWSEIRREYKENEDYVYSLFPCLNYWDGIEKYKKLKLYIFVNKIYHKRNVKYREYLNNPFEYYEEVPDSLEKIYISAEISDVYDRVINDIADEWEHCNDVWIGSDRCWFWTTRTTDANGNVLSMWEKIEPKRFRQTKKDICEPIELGDGSYKYFVYRKIIKTYRGVSKFGDETTYTDDAHTMTYTPTNIDITNTTDTNYWEFVGNESKIVDGKVVTYALYRCKLLNRNGSVVYQKIYKDGLE